MLDSVRPVHYKKKYLKQKGQTLIEVLVAAAVGILVIVGLVGVTVTSIKNAQFAKNQATATKYAQQEMENVRLERDRTWSVFWNKQGTTSGPTPVTGAFLKSVQYIDASVPTGSQSKMQVTVTVTWTDYSGTHQSQLVSYFTRQNLWQ